MKKNSGQNLYIKAKELIPGGTMLLSKRPEMFLPDNWPSYFSKAKDVFVWDLDNKKYTDTSIMGIGTNSLGYGNEKVDKAVLKTISNGNMSTLNCPEEVYLAEKLIEIEPWADMVRFARSGGEANSIAVRIARAASGKDGVAYCGYHGWHDWYLAANHNSEEDELKHQLLPGLSTDGIPKALKNTSFPFFYNDIDSLERILKNHSIGVIKMEVFRNMEPNPEFLQNVRKLASQYNAVLIFDECTSGFRETFGGLYKKYGVFPDMTMFGKTLGNGYAITAVVGKKEVMNSVQKTFISSTFWTERIGPSAALATLKEMESCKSWEIITNIGEKVKNIWSELSTSYNVPIKVNGLNAIATFNFDSKDHNLFKTYLTQEMLKKDFLATTAFYSCIKHDQIILDTYQNHLAPIFHKINQHINGNCDLNKLLNGPICHSGMKRLN
jgi:glutamate-1-semialdehyde aminotransferase